MTIAQIRDLVTSAKLDKALKAAANHPGIQADEDNATMITLFQGQNAQNERSNRMNLITSAEYNRERNRITYGLLDLLGDLDDDAAAGNPAPTVVSTPSPTQPTTSPTAASPGDDLAAQENEMRILFLAANPSDTAKLQLTHEHSLVSQRLQEAPEPEKFPIRYKRAVTPSAFQQSIFKYKPHIVHFSGHGDRQAPDVKELVATRAGRPEGNSANSNDNSTAEESGIFLYDEDLRNSHFVSTTYLKRVFKSMVQRQGIPIQVILFNACHSEEQAKVISQYVPYVVGTSWSVKDRAASAFASGFYFGISNNMDVESAVDYAINETLPYNEPEDRFILYKDGVKVEW